jgi:DNA-binding NtrC family response regulator
MTAKDGMEEHPSVSNRVLVVDDERVIADSLFRIFDDAGYDAKAVYGAEEALLLMRTWIPDAAFIDVHLPAMHGIDLSIRLKAKYPECRLVLLSGRGSTSELLDEAIRKGHSFECIAKPVHQTVLLSLLFDLIPPAADPRPHAPLDPSEEMFEGIEIAQRPDSCLMVAKTDP